MTNKYDEYIDELHQRGYSVYDDCNEAQTALQELYARSYRIIDDEGQESLHRDYLYEFDRLGRDESLTTWQQRAKLEDLFPQIETTKPKLSKVKNNKLQALFGGILLYKENIEKKKHEEKKRRQEQRRKARAEEKKSQIIEPKIPFVFECDADHYFCIKKEGTPKRYCKALGLYDPISKKFIVKKGSIVSEEMSSKFKYSISGTNRRKEVHSSCDLIGLGYRVKKDIVFDTPNTAASFVIGDYANGGTEWKDDKGKAFEQQYSYIW